MSSIEKAAYDFLKEEVEALSDEASPLFGAAVLKDEYEEIPKDSPRGIRIGKCDSLVVPNSGMTEVKHVDAILVIIFYVRIDRGKKQERSSYRDQAVEMAEAAALLIFSNPTMGDTVEDARPRKLPRGMDDTDNTPYAVSNLYVSINETGGADRTDWRTR